MEFTLKTLQEKFQSLKNKHFNNIRENLEAFFKIEEDYKIFLFRHNKFSIPKIEFKDVKGRLFLTIDVDSLLRQRQF
jgi:hypothetical protein